MNVQDPSVLPFSVVGLTGKPGEGPHMAIVLKILGELIVQARYSTYGCTTAEVCGQWVCDAVEGNSVTAAKLLDESNLIRGLGAMPLGREHCGIITISALVRALDEAAKRTAGAGLVDAIGEVEGLIDADE